MSRASSLYNYQLAMNICNKFCNNSENLPCVLTGGSFFYHEKLLFYNVFKKGSVIFLVLKAQAISVCFHKLESCDSIFLANTFATVLYYTVLLILKSSAK